MVTFPDIDLNSGMSTTIVLMCLYQARSLTRACFVACGNFLLDVVMSIQSFTLNMWTPVSYRPYVVVCVVYCVLCVIRLLSRSRIPYISVSHEH